jgi:DnaJ-class molecular chaperone
MIEKSVLLQKVCQKHQRRYPPIYYKVLDVSTDASRDEIKKAYRRLSMLYHPDASTDPDAEKKMKEINKAHDVLSDPDKRARYDNFENAFKG